MRWWMRHEARQSERRAPIVPEDARRLIDAGFDLVVETSTRRAFPAREYAAAGCRVVPPGSWTKAPPEDWVLGLGEPPAEPWPLRHRHVFFGHAYRGRPAGAALLERFAAGGGELLDLEHLVDGKGTRLAAFGYWAGYAGAALAVLHRAGLLTLPVAPLTRPELEERLRLCRRSARAGRAVSGGAVSVLVTGADGRCGRGARDALAAADVDTTGWGPRDTTPLPRGRLLAHDVLIHAIGPDHPVPPFLTRADLSVPGRRLSLLCDISCDLGSPFDAVPVYDRLTDWDRPVRRLPGTGRPLDVIAIDNLATLLPVESSRDFSAALTPHLLALATGTTSGQEPWERSQNAFRRATAARAARRVA
ncbi:saccharopine dehydrogenase [Streptomyces sp. ms191]|uniref:saccharopine dehydrogenase n=1 Tax=Streptomyces sp. ms191 TaxID=1827978 RepID=UPI0011CE9622|nr:saccharopine dehydrogenase [Streptomyces sp. ms191]TXS16177.1 saccharopine dehydrogenase [Streptomyces sp. ms191]